MLRMRIVLSIVVSLANWAFPSRAIHLQFQKNQERSVSNSSFQIQASNSSTLGVNTTSLNAVTLFKIHEESMSLTTVQLQANGTNGTLDTGEDLVSYSCNAESGSVALQAIKDAINMAKVVQRVWNLTQYESILRTYMGDSCVGNETWQNWTQCERLLGLAKIDTHCQ